MAFALICQEGVWWLTGGKSAKIIGKVGEPGLRVIFPAALGECEIKKIEKNQCVPDRLKMAFILPPQTQLTTMRAAA